MAFSDITTDNETPTDYSDTEIKAFFQSRLPIINDANKLLPIFLVGVGNEKQQPPVVRRSGFLYHQFIFVVVGTGIFEYDNKKTIIKQGSCIFIPKHIPHAYYGSSKEFTTAWISFDGTFAEPLLQQFSMSSICIIYSSRSTTSLFPLHQKLLTIASHRYDAERLSAITYELIVEFYKQQLHDSTSFDFIFELEKIKIYIDHHYKNDISLDFLAEKFQISKYKICREYTKYYGYSPNQYQLLLRIQEAKNLLIQTNSTIKEISKSVGFEDNVYFGKVFKKFELVTPKQYRNFHKI